MYAPSIDETYTFALAIVIASTVAEKWSKNCPRINTVPALTGVNTMPSTSPRVLDKPESSSAAKLVSDAGGMIVTPFVSRIVR
jgi:hypothetical protein